MKSISVCLILLAVAAIAGEAKPLKKAEETFERLYAELASALRDGLLREEVGPAVEKYNRLAAIAQPDEGLMLNILHRDLSQELDHYKSVSEAAEDRSNTTAMTGTDDLATSEMSSDHLGSDFHLYTLWFLHGATLITLAAIFEMSFRTRNRVNQLKRLMLAVHKVPASEAEPLTSADTTSM